MNTIPGYKASVPSAAGNKRDELICVNRKHGLGIPKSRQILMANCSKISTINFFVNRRVLRLQINALSQIDNGLVRFRPDHAASTWFAGEDARPGLGAAKWNNPDRYLEAALVLFLNGARAVPMRERKPAVDFRLGGILWREEFVEFLFAVNLARMPVTELSCAREQVLLDRH